MAGDRPGVAGEGVEFGAGWLSGSTRRRLDDCNVQGDHLKSPIKNRSYKIMIRITISFKKKCDMRHFVRRDQMGV